jgi:hypothetical protein
MSHCNCNQTIGGHPCVRSCRADRARFALSAPPRPARPPRRPRSPLDINSASEGQLYAGHRAGARQGDYRRSAYNAKIAYKRIGPITPENLDAVLKREIDKALANP